MYDDNEKTKDTKELIDSLCSTEAIQKLPKHLREMTVMHMVGYIKGVTDRNLIDGGKLAG